jgi:hypothetical protein
VVVVEREHCSIVRNRGERGFRGRGGGGGKPFLGQNDKMTKYCLVMRIENC